MLYCYRLFQMMKHAWDSYRQYGWGHNELKPLAKKGHSTNIFGRPDKPLSPTTVCANWQFAHTVVNHTWVHAWMRAVLLTVRHVAHTHSQTQGDTHPVLSLVDKVMWWCLQQDAFCFGRSVCKQKHNVTENTSGDHILICEMKIRTCIWSTVCI